MDTSTLEALGWPADKPTRGRRSMPASIPTEAGGLPVGAYALDDGRKVRGMNEFELKASARQAWGDQARANESLERRLAIFRLKANPPGRE